MKQIYIVNYFNLTGINNAYSISATGDDGEDCLITALNGKSHLN